MNKLNQLSREEMRKVMGGVISTDTTLEMCLNQVQEQISTIDEPIEAGIMRSVLTDACHRAHREMNDASPYNGNY